MLTPCLPRWPEYFQVAESPSGKIMGYIMGKAEARDSNPVDWHGHVTAISVADEYRRWVCLYSRGSVYCKGMCPLNTTREVHAGGRNEGVSVIP